MPLKIQPTNRPKIDLDGYCKGRIIKVEIIEANDEIKFDSIKWTFESEGILRPVISYRYTPLTYNTNIESPEDEHEDDMPLFEKFADTRLNITANVLKQLGLLTDKTIEQLRSGEVSLEDVEIDLEQIYGVPLRYKIGRSGMRYLIDRSTIELLHK
jgi:hypothetical protein